MSNILSFTAVRQPFIYTVISQPVFTTVRHSFWRPLTVWYHCRFPDKHVLSTTLRGLLNSASCGCDQRLFHHLSRAPLSDPFLLPHTNTLSATIWLAGAILVIHVTDKTYVWAVSVCLVRSASVSPFQISLGVIWLVGAFTQRKLMRTMVFEMKHPHRWRIQQRRCCASQILHRCTVGRAHRTYRRQQVTDAFTPWAHLPFRTATRREASCVQGAADV